MSIWGTAFKGSDVKSDGYLNLKTEFDKILAHRELAIKRGRPDYEIKAIDCRIEELVFKMDVYVRTGNRV